MQLKQRLLTAVVLIPTVIWCVLYLPTDIFAALFALFVLLGSWEWSRLIPLVKPWAQAVYALLVMLVLWRAWQVRQNPVAVQAVLGSACLWWITASVWLRHPGVGVTGGWLPGLGKGRSEEHTSELQSQSNLA